MLRLPIRACRELTVHVKATCCLKSMGGVSFFFLMYPYLFIFYGLTHGIWKVPMQTESQAHL